MCCHAIGWKTWWFCRMPQITLGILIILGKRMFSVRKGVRANHRLTKGNLLGNPHPQWVWKMTWNSLWKWPLVFIFGLNVRHQLKFRRNGVPCFRRDPELLAVLSSVCWILDFRRWNEGFLRTSANSSLIRRDIEPATDVAGCGCNIYFKAPGMCQFEPSCTQKPELSPRILSMLCLFEMLQLPGFSSGFGSLRNPQVPVIIFGYAWMVSLCEWKICEKMKKKHWKMLWKDRFNMVYVNLQASDPYLINGSGLKWDCDNQHSTRPST